MIGRGNYILGNVDAEIVAQHPPALADHFEVRAGDINADPSTWQISAQAFLDEQATLSGVEGTVYAQVRYLANDVPGDWSDSKLLG